MILLDTHVWLWFISNPELLSKTAMLFTPTEDLFPSRNGQF